MNLDLFPWREKQVRMVWQVEKDSRRSYLVGTAHFFPYSFEKSIRKLLLDVDMVLFEGPLDEDSMERVAQYGRCGGGSEELVRRLDPRVIQEIDRELSRRIDGNLGLELVPFYQPREPLYFEALTRGVRPWMAFFSVWTTYLGWRYSVDKQGYQVACQLGKPIHFLETIEEQIAVLDGIPLERLANQLSEVSNWDKYIGAYQLAYLKGDLPGLLSLSGRFPTRTPAVISGRDRILFERLLEFAEKRSTAIFLGAPHIPGVSALLEGHGYRVVQRVP